MPRYTSTPRPLVQTEVAASTSQLTNDGALLLDFGKAAFGSLRIPNGGGQRMPRLVVHLGERLTPAGRLDRSPPGSIRYCRIECCTQATDTRIVIPPNERNTGRAAIRMPVEIGEVFPFRYAEIENAADIDGAKVRQICVHYPFDDTASAFTSSDTTPQRCLGSLQTQHQGNHLLRRLRGW